MDLLAKPQIICHVEKVLDYTIHDVKWIPSSAKFVTLGGKSNGSGVIEIYELHSEGVEKVGEFGKKEHFKCGSFDASSLRNRHLATGDFCGRLQVWDLEDNLIPVYKSTKHKGIINAIDGVAGTSIGCGAPEIVTGSKDGTVMVWDVRQKDDPVATFRAATDSSARDCWSVVFGNSYNSEERVVAAGYDNGDIKMYDLRSMKVLWSKCVKNGVVSLQFDRKDIQMNKLVATTLESKIVCFDVRTQHPTRGFAQLSEKAHDSTVWQVKHLPQNREIFMTTGGAGSMCLWKYIYPDKRVDKDGDGIPVGVIGELQLIQNSTLSGQPITSFDWCKDKLGLAVCSSFDQTVRVLITTKLNLI
ncbi:PREDICTED: WD repeat-containing protein 92 [Nicrophorus vespilloides]|uniref:WD repeat-containing protein 92 n=1 Tax=Nicrophorus vespilloides TaxID=110193 RepID=A0ABM1MYH6_NICVS|nr:PREDICTED: WD repeat-containing protein 92 [Nicrophorus vespilloides]